MKGLIKGEELSLSEKVYQVRKTGCYRTEKVREAIKIIDEAMAQGYNFGRRKVGWNWVVVDLDK